MSCSPWSTSVAPWRCSSTTRLGRTTSSRCAVADTGGPAVLRRRQRLAVAHEAEHGRPQAARQQVLPEAPRRRRSGPDRGRPRRPGDHTARRNRSAATNALGIGDEVADPGCVRVGTRHVVHASCADGRRRDRAGRRQASPPSASPPSASPPSPSPPPSAAVAITVGAVAVGPVGVSTVAVTVHRDDEGVAGLPLGLDVVVRDAHAPTLPLACEADTTVAPEQSERLEPGVAEARGRPARRRRPGRSGRRLRAPDGSRRGRRRARGSDGRYSTPSVSATSQQWATVSTRWNDTAAATLKRWAGESSGGGRVRSSSADREHSRELGHRGGPRRRPPVVAVDGASRPKSAISTSSPRDGGGEAVVLAGEMGERWRRSQPAHGVGRARSDAPTHDTRPSRSASASAWIGRWSIINSR